ncbi:golgin subfamily A member 2-like, partial [Uloborus diversus]|uniref:golgin subfamily A member 2-like n=1 Tax=Uloborus diversus TaxID=327109 RepID=UPI0024095BBC
SIHVILAVLVKVQIAYSFKQFQQRTTKTKGVKKKTVVPKNADPVAEEISGSRETSPESVIDLSEGKVPSVNSKNNFEQTKNRSSSITALNDNSSPGDVTNSSDDKNASLNAASKSKSDLDLSTVKEFSSTESLRQISLQVNGLMSETNAFVNGNIDEDGVTHSTNKSLEKRNQELALLVNNLQQSNDHLHFQLQELKAKNKRLGLNFEQEKKELLERSHKEQVSLNDQLQVHIQTIGILVAEKTELQSSLSLSQQSAKQKAGEVEELQGRLRALRQRTSDLDRELNSLSNSNQHLEKVNKEISKDIERLKLDNYKFSKTNEELKSANAELSEKLNRRISDFNELEKELSECRTKLAAAEVKLKQSSESGESSSQLEEIYHQKIELEKRISLHKESIDKLINERDQMSEQYQQYIQQLSQQVTSLRDEIKQLSSEKDMMSKERDSLLERLESQKNIQDSTVEDPSEFKVQLNILENQKEELSFKLENLTSVNSNLEKRALEREERIAELEVLVARLKEDQVDQGRLVETMQSDKVAASRAMAQNRELKKQLEELQSGFVEMSNTKLELAEKLHSEQHICKELGERLSQQEEELHDLREQLTQKDEELQNLEKSNTKGIYQQNQIADRMRHYEAQGHLAEMLQKELHSAQEQINSLVQQNSELRMAIATQAEVAVSDENQKEDKDASKRNDLVASLSASVRQLEMERNQLMKQLEEQKSNRTNLEEQLKKKETMLDNNDGETIDIVSKDEYSMMKRAMEQLEERFKQTMNRIAELSDERQQLEHLVLQLQGETDTIGDYIALYQIQRGLMRKRASEKDDYIAQLARDREDLKTKLGELQGLVMRLLEERKLFQAQGTVLDQKIDISHLPHTCDVNGTSSEEEPFVESPPAIVGDASVSTKKPEATARKIMDLLTEIETTNLVEKPVLDSFHPCPVCSGRLITV